MQFITTIISIIITSFYLFPVYFKAFPIANTKMIIGVIGLIALANDLITEKRNASINKDFLGISGIALGISLVSIFTMLYNVTKDTSFVTYFFSLWVWLGGAYGVISLIKLVKFKISVEIVGKYLVYVCATQCILAYIFSLNPDLDQMITGVLGGEEAFMGVDTGDRMHGFGAALDVAGFKFSASLMIASILISRLKKEDYYHFYIYSASYIIIAIVGNMIARSTTIGLAISLAYILFKVLLKKDSNSYFKKILIIIIILLPIITCFYYFDLGFRSKIRFAFEGFFSLIENGKWESGSNDDLMKMIKFPDNIKTWLIGDGYAANPQNDPYYVGRMFHGFYMGTDIGYLRFIFYFGLIGATLMIGLYLKIWEVLIKRLPGWGILFSCLILINFIEWLKVTSDQFSVLAPFLCLAFGWDHLGNYEEEDQSTSDTSNHQLN